MSSAEMSSAERTVEERMNEIAESFRKSVLAEFPASEVLVVAVFVKTLLGDHVRANVNSAAGLGDSEAQDMVNRLDASFTEVVDAVLAKSPNLLRTLARPRGVS